MFKTSKISPAERARVFDYLIFKIKHGGNIVNALRTYMEGNKSKASRPIQAVLDRITTNGEAFVDVALDFGLIDRRGYLILTSGVEPSKALPVIRSNNATAKSGVTLTILTDLAKKWLGGVVFGWALLADATRGPMVSIFEKMNQAAEAAGSTPVEVPAYLANPWLVMGCVLAFGALVSSLLGALWWANRNRTDLVYRYLPFRFYEDWVSLLDLYLAFKAAGQSDFKAAQSLAASQPEGSFIAKLFLDIAESMRVSGRSFYDALSEYEDSFPQEVLAFFLDASKTGQIDTYMLQAKTYCVERLEALTQLAKQWVPAITGVIMLMTFGLMVADIFVSITMASMKPITG
mgnify:FL=1